MKLMKKGTTIRGVNFMIVEIVIAVALLVIPSLCYVIINIIVDSLHYH